MISSAACTALIVWDEDWFGISVSDQQRAIYIFVIAIWSLLLKLAKLCCCSSAKEEDIDEDEEENTSLKLLNVIGFFGTLSDVIFDIVQGTALFIGAAATNYFDSVNESAYIKNLIFSASVIGFFAEFVDFVSKQCRSPLSCFSLFIMASICVEHGLGAEVANTLAGCSTNYECMSGYNSEEQLQFDSFWYGMMALHIIVCIVSGLITCCSYSWMVGECGQRPLYNTVPTSASK